MESIEWTKSSKTKKIKTKIIIFQKIKILKLFEAYKMKDLESEEKIAIDIAKLERNLKQVDDINFEGKEKEVFDRAIAIFSSLSRSFIL